jgi:hypothetical protein
LIWVVPKHDHFAKQPFLHLLHCCACYWLLQCIL